MSASKRPKLDFSAMLASSRQVVTDVQALDKKVNEIKSSLMTYQSEDMERYRRLVKMSTDDNVEVFLVCRLGLRGLDCLRNACQIVPNQYLDKRFGIITRIVNKVLNCSNKSPITVDECKMMGQLEKILSYPMKSDAACDDNLWELTEECGKFGYTAFLGPPTTVCLNLSCNRHPLSSYTSPTKITLYDISGPRPASKISLRCSNCKVNYNYSMFGNKTLNGERYYDDEREYVEASDLVFVNRGVHQLFATLRYIYNDIIMLIIACIARQYYTYIIHYMQCSLLGVFFWIC